MAAITEVVEPVMEQKAVAGTVGRMAAAGMAAEATVEERLEVVVTEVE